MNMTFTSKIPRCSSHITALYFKPLFRDGDVALSPRIQRAWRDSVSRRGSSKKQDKDHISIHGDGMVPSEEPVTTTGISAVRPR